MSEDDIEFRRDLAAAYGAVETLSPLIRRVICNNPSPFTFKGTNSFIIGRGTVAVIDPGPDDPAHLHALGAALAGEAVSHILVTHSHLDHSPLAPALKALTGAPILGFGPQASHGSAGEAGGDARFDPDRRLADGEMVSGPGWTLEAIHTPGHASNHLCFALAEEATILSGDHVMGWSTTVVSPPDGDMAHYMASLDKLRRRPERRYIPAHGPEIPDGPAFTRALLGHRRHREGAILRRVIERPSDVAGLVAAIYKELDPRLVPAASRSVLAHLIKLVDDGKIRRDGEIYRSAE
ncbi:MAG TPA: MBL fold metallo-hydrolase [Aliidongia sp.]|nr:MBL fold metallo-hydrolase [Aliidongia sp.]